MDSLGLPQTAHLANRDKTFLNRLLAIICMSLLTATFAVAQGTRGTIRGNVKDPNGAIVTGASVKLTDVIKGTEIRTVQTNEEGEYQFLELEPATYQITITSTGFAEARLNEIKVEPNRNLQLDVNLTLGTTTEDVTVTASQELLDRSTPTLGTTVDRRRVQDLPLNGRQVLNLALLQPGVVATAGFGSGVGIRVNGQRGVENNVQLDGSNNNEVAVGGQSGASPRPDAVQEFRLLTSNYEAEFGRNTGAIINVVTRSGGNDFHGNARIFYRPTFLSAARFFDQDQFTDNPRRKTGECPADRNLRSRDNCDYRRIFERKEIGGNIGGPIYLPRFGEGGPAVYNGRDRAFFFVDYERFAQKIGDTRTISSLPTAAERAGNFSALGRTLIDPVTRLPFPGNQIPVSRFSPIALYYLQFLPVPAANGQATVGADQITNNHFLTGRVDFRITDEQSLNFTLNVFDQQQDDPFAFGGASVPGFGSQELRRSYNYVARHTYTISPTVVNSLLLGYARNNQPGVFSQNRTTPAEIGFTGNFVADPTVAGPPNIRLFDRGDINLGNSIQGPQTRVSENFQIQDSVSLALGRHTVKFGVDGTQYKQDQLFSFVNNGTFGFSRLFGGNTSNDAFADFLLGNPSFYQFGATGLRDFRQFAGAAFVQDNWRATDALTLSLGLRYEYNSPLTDKFNRVAYFRPGATSQLLVNGSLRDENGRPITIPAGERAPVGLVFVGDPDPVLGGKVPEGGVEKDFNNFAPRVGFAYAPAYEGGLGRTLFGDRQAVLRGGFGISYGAIIGDTALQQLSAPGYNGTNFFSFSSGAGTLANPFAPDPFPLFRGNGGSLPNPFAATSTQVFAPLFQFSQPVDPRIRTPYTMQYNLTFERGFYNDYVFRIAYVGNRGRKLYTTEEVNPAFGTLIPTPAGRSLPQDCANDTNGNGTIEASEVFGCATPDNIDARRINGDIQTGLGQLVSAGNSYFDSMQVDVQKRLGNDGLLFQLAYTLAKSINDAGESQRGGLDLINRRFGRGPSSDDARHRLVGSFIYDLPFFKTTTGFTNRLLDGWSIGGIYTYQSNTPFSVFNQIDEVGTSGIQTFVDINQPFQATDPRQTGSRAFNANAFRTTPGVFAEDFFGTQYYVNPRRGTAGRNQFRAHNEINNLDMILSKKTRISETTNFELRFEAFNALNHTQFTTINTNIDSPSFGLFTAAREARVVQLGARFSF